MDDYHFSNIAKKKFKNNRMILEKKKAYNSTKNGNILCIENKIVKYLMNAFFN